MAKSSAFESLTVEQQEAVDWFVKDLLKELYNSRMDGQIVAEKIEECAQNPKNVKLAVTKYNEYLISQSDRLIEQGGDKLTRPDVTCKDPTLLKRLFPDAPKEIKGGQDR